MKLDKTNEILFKYLRKFNISENTIKKILFNKSIYSYDILPDTILKLALSLKHGLSYKKIKYFIPFILNQKKLELLKLNNHLLSSNLLILENNHLIDPLSNQYYLNFNKNPNNTELLDIFDIYKIIYKYYEEENYQKVYELLSIILKNKNYRNKLDNTKKFFFYEIYGKTILNLFSERDAIHIFINLKRQTKDFYFYKFIAMILLFHKHYKFSYKFFDEYYNLIQREYNELSNLQEELQNIKFILDLLKIINTNTSKKDLKLINDNGVWNDT